MLNFKAELKRIEAFVFDVDGVFANDMFYLSPEGEFLRSMHSKDGFAVRTAIKANYPVGIISGGTSENVRQRLKGLGVTDIYLGSAYKLNDFKDFYMKYQLNPENILYMGDDIPDYEVLKAVGFPTCPQDAAPEIKAICCYISPFAGGMGCVRDVIEQSMRAQNTWPNPSA